MPVLISSLRTVFARQHPSCSPSQHTDTGGYVVITGVGKRNSNTPIQIAGGWFVVLGESSTPPVCRRHAVMLFQACRPNTTFHVEAGMAQVNVGYIDVPKKPNQFAFEEFQLQAINTKAIFKDILLVFINRRRPFPNKQSTFEVDRLKYIVCLFLSLQGIL